MASFTWNGSAKDGNYNNPANWTPNGIPGATDTVSISTAAATAINASNAAAGALTTNSHVTLAVSDNATFTLGSGTGTSTFSNGGTFALNSTNDNTDLVVGDSKLTLSGAGTILLDNNAGNRIYGASATDILSNGSNLIEGAGQLGAGQLTFVNGASGVVDANQSNALVLNTGTIAVSNAGLLEATAGATLDIQSAVTDTTAGKITAAGGTVELQNGAVVTGGTLATSAGGAIAVAFNQTATLSGLANKGSVAVNDYGTLSLLGSIVNTGSIALQSTNDTTYLIVAGSSVSLTGTGTVLLGDNGNNFIQGAAAADALNNVNNTISGAGHLGNGQLTLINAAAGVIDATYADQALVLNTGSTVSNAGLLEATAGATLDIQSAVTDSSTGKITAAGGTVELQNGAVVQGGTLATSGVGAIAVAYNQSATLSGLANTGSVAVNDYGTLSLLGSIVNTGSIALQSTNETTYLIVAGSSVSLTGTGTVLLDDNGNNFIQGAAAADALNNVNNTISGAGHLGNGMLTLINGTAGVIDATYADNALVLNTGSTLANSGLIESTGGATLVVQNTTVNDSTGGTLLAGAGSVVNLETGTTVAGGTVNSSGTGQVVVAYNNAATLDGSAQILTNLGTVAVQDYGTLSLLGTIANSGAITLGSTNDSTYLQVGPGGATPGTVTLTGSGVVTLSDNANNYFYGSVAGDGLINLNNTISGAGQLGSGQLVLTNDATIDATGSNALVLHTGNTVANNGLIEATGTGGLLLQNDTVSNASGTVLAAGSTVSLQNGATIAGGLVQSTGAGVVQVSYNESGTLSGLASALTLQGQFQATDYGSLSVLGTIVNTGTISLLSTNDSTELMVASPTVTLTGAGSVVLDDNANNYIFGAVAADTLVNTNNTISGAGHFGDGQLTLVNGTAGIIDATGSNALVLTTGNTVTNNGLIEATGTGGLLVQTDTVSNAAGTVLAAGSTVSLQNSASIAGGLVKSTGAGVVQVTYNQSGTLSGLASAITLQGQVQATDYGSLSVLGSIVNTGTISLLSTNDSTELVIASPTVTLSGAGTVVLSDNANNYIFGLAAGDTLDNVNNTISGAGHIGAGQLVLVNATAGTIDATGGNALLLSTGNTVTNKGLIEATGSGGLLVQGDTISNTGTVLAAGSTVGLQNGASIAGGLVKSTGAGAVQVTYSESGTLSGAASALIISGHVQATDYGSLSVLGSIVNTGTISLLSTNDSTELVVASPTVTLSGAGSLVLSDNANNFIFGATAADTLVNVNNTISGAGNFGDGQLTLVNAGTIAATGGNALVISLGSTATNTATGQLLGVGAGGLSVQNGTYSNAGLIQADSGSSVTFSSNATLTNDSSAGTLTGGTYAAVAGSSGATLAITGAAVTTDNANIVLSGAAASLSFGGTAIEASLATIGARSELQVLGGRSYTTTLAVASSGTVALGGGTFSAKSLTTRAGSLLSGFGTIAGPLISNGTLAVSGGALVLTGSDGITGPVSGTGTLTFSGGHTTIADTNPITVSTISLINAATLAISKSVSFAGTFNIVGTSAIGGTGAITTSGLFEETGRGTVKIANPFTNSGTLSTVLLGTLAFSGGLANTGIILDNGGFTDTAALTGGSLYIGGQGTTAVIASMPGCDASTVSTLSIVGGTLNTSGTNVIVSGDYVNDATGAGNAYNAGAHVTGTIDGKGTQLSVVGVEGTSIQSVNGTLTIAVSAGGSAHFEIENTGAAGSAALRGALQTSVNGGSITGTALSGNGVTAQNFGPILAGGHGGIYTITDKGGTLTNESIHLASDFANVAGLTIDIVAAPAPGAVAASVGGLHLPVGVSADVLPWLHHG